MHDFRGGGAEKVSICLANEFYRIGYSVVISVLSDNGPMRNLINENIKIEKLGPSRTLFSIPSLTKRIKKIRPWRIVSHLTHINVVASIAALIAGYRKKLIVVEHNMPQKNFELISSKLVKISYILSKVLYKIPIHIVCVSEGVKEGVANYCQVNSKKLVTIHNPVVHEKQLMANRFRNPNLHNFFKFNDIPIFLAVGSLTEQKNFSNLVEAFSYVSNKMDCRLLILGEGHLRESLQRQIKLLGLDKKIELLGFKKNVDEYMLAADVFVLSSDWEGLPTVLIEALATDMKVISTDCPSGPREILVDGEFGKLVQVNDSKSLIAAMLDISNQGKVNVRSRAKDFLVTKAAQKYIELLEGAK